jgi:hypothetical protein
MMTLSRRIVISGLLGLALAWIGSPARADQVWTVTVNTSQMTADYTGPFGIDFELLNGGSNNNTVTLSNFQFNDGAAVAGPIASPGAMGNLGTVVTLTDTGGQFLIDFNQGFVPSSTTISFTMDSTLNAPTMGNSPDNFSMVLFSSYTGYDPTTNMGGTLIPTTDPTSADTFFNFNIPLGTPPVNVYSTPNADITLTVTPQGAVPEPTSLITLFLGVTGVLAAARWRRSRAARRRSQAPVGNSATQEAS